MKKEEYLKKNRKLIQNAKEEFVKDIDIELDEKGAYLRKTKLNSSPGIVAGLGQVIIEHYTKLGWTVKVVFIPSPSLEQVIQFKIY